MNEKKNEESKKAVATETEILYKEECYRIQGAIFEVYREMGCGFLESVYQECLTRELQSMGIPAKPQAELELHYKGERLTQTYLPDFICFDKIIIELKAAGQLCVEHRAQIFNYLKASKLRLGLLVNFGHHPKVEMERIIR